MTHPEPSFDLGRFEALTFDCYGTLIDWERGLVTALRTLLGASAHDLDDDALLGRFARLEAPAQGGPFRSYRSVLAEVARRLGEELATEVSAAAAATFADSVGDWPPFDDCTLALRALGTRYRLAIVSNVDDDLFEASRRRLGVDFDEVVTAEQVRSYKPAPAHFREALTRLDLPPERVLHVAQSLFHDIAPARRFGLATVWVNRRHGRPGSGATPPATAVPDLEVPDLRSLAERASPGAI